MEVKAVMRNARMSPQKVREVTRRIQGLGAEEALAVLRFIPRKSARLVGKTLRSAIANAENNNQLRPELLRVKEATVGSGRILKRWVAKARGSAGPIRKRSCNIRIVLTDQG
ncbi:MAG: 50S ribosomal protein L22 [Verrucomicrobia bacterium]|nr:50S ribosomal protein L22 [Verrucomicrobiota bacterium]